MKSRRSHARHAAVVRLAALLLLLSLAPAAATAQRRRPAPRRTAPPAPAAPAAAAPSPSESQRQEAERPFDTSVAADSYVVYVELRNLGQLVHAPEVRTALEAFRLIGGAPPEVTDVIDFLTANEEALAGVRVFSAVMPTRAGLPDGVAALQFPTPEAARAFEPKLRALFEQMGDALGRPPAAAATPRGRGSSRRSRQTKKTPPVVTKRAGSWIYAAPAAFTFKSLKGNGARTLADNARLQSFRSRLASESVFVYYETALWRTAWQLKHEEMLKQHEAEAAAAHGTTTTTDPAVSAVAPAPPLAPEGDPKNTPPPADAETAVIVQGPVPEPSPAEEYDAQDAQTAEEAARLEAERASAAAAASPKSAEERAARAMMTTLMSGIFGGSTREPEATALGVALEGDALVARLLVSRDADAPNNIIPFFPNVVSGPAAAPESFAYAPADSEVFLSASFDWARIYDSLLETMNKTARLAADEARDGEGPAPREGEAAGGPAAAMRPAPAEKGVEAMEKLFGFRLREDLLPALGSEVALSVPVYWFEGRRRGVTGANEEGGDAGEKKAEAGAVALISLKDPEAVRRVMPLALAALGLGVPRQAAPPEQREGFDVHDLGGPAYAFVNNFLVVGETAPAVRHVVDAYAANRTLAASTRFRDAVAWQEHQRLAFGYLSDALMTRWVEGTRRMADGSSDPITLAALAQLEVPPAPASYAATDKGDALLHEVRLPVSLAKIFAASTVIQIKESPVLNTESAVRYSLQYLVSAQTAFKEGKGQGRYGTLEELYAAKVLEEEYALNDEYAYELRVSGDKFTVTATPKNYGVTGRRSFFTDETGVVRAANHKGEPATAADPPVDQ